MAEILSKEAIKKLQKHQAEFTALVTNAHTFLQMDGAEANIENWQAFIDARVAEWNKYVEMVSRWRITRENPKCPEDIKSRLGKQMNKLRKGYDAGIGALLKAEELHSCMTHCKSACRL